MIQNINACQVVDTTPRLEKLLQRLQEVRRFYNSLNTEYDSRLRALDNESLLLLKNSEESKEPSNLIEALNLEVLYLENIAKDTESLNIRFSKIV